MYATENVPMPTANNMLDGVQSVPVPATPASETIEVNGKSRTIRKAVRGKHAVKFEASSATEVANVEYANDIFQHANFHDLEHFKTVWKDYQSKTNTTYKRDGSEFLHADTDPAIKDKFKYKFIVFKCIHHGKPRKRSTGLRPRQQYLALGCESRLRLYFRPKTNDMCITVFEGAHNHKRELVKTDKNGRKILPELLDTDTNDADECVPKKRQKLAEPSTDNTPALPNLSNTSSTSARTPLALINPPESSSSSNVTDSPPLSTTSNTSDMLIPSLLALIIPPESSGLSNVTDSPPLSTTSNTSSTPVKTSSAPLNNYMSANSQTDIVHGLRHMSTRLLGRIFTLFSNPRQYNLCDAQISLLQIVASRLIQDISNYDALTNPQAEVNGNDQ